MKDKRENNGRQDVCGVNKGGTAEMLGPLSVSYTHLALKNPEALNKVVVSNANEGNGYLNKVSAKLIYTDDTSSDAVSYTHLREGEAI